MRKLLTFTAIAMALAQPAAAQSTVRIGTTADNPPYTTLAPEGAPAGYEIALGAEICARAGLTCEFVLTPWATIIPDLRAGAFDVIMTGMAISEPRRQLIDFSEPYYPAGISHFAARAGTNFDFAALAGTRIGMNGGTIQAAYAEANLAPANTIVLYPDFEAAMTALEAGEIDLVLAHTGFVMPRVAATNGALAIVGPDVPIGGGVAAGFRKEDAALREAFDRVIRELKADGSLNALIAEWFDPPQFF
ncbi:MAG: transporter substrate-binding domain-containing protein [Bauldia sp.]|nr:transporter substrate-binding domain-containing protein [Bauldia sp.]